MLQKLLRSQEFAFAQILVGSTWRISMVFRVLPYWASTHHRNGCLQRPASFFPIRIFLQKSDTGLDIEIQFHLQILACQQLSELFKNYLLNREFNMNWKWLRLLPCLDTRARFVSATPDSGTLLDIGSSDGQTLSHFSELRPDIRLHSTDIEGVPQRYPEGTVFHQCDIQRNTLPWDANLMDRITCMHVVEHLRDTTNLYRECFRLLKPGGLMYIETPHPKSLIMSSPSLRQIGQFTLNFYDDITHVRIIPSGETAARARQFGFEIVKTGISRNWVFASLYPLLVLTHSSRSKCIAYIHFKGWSSYVILRKPDS